MNDSKTPQYASVEQPFGCDPAIAHCPICGKASIELSKEGQGNVTPCDHLAFIFHADIKEFIYQSKDFEKRIRKIKIDTADFEESGFEDVDDLLSEDFSEALVRAGYDNKLLVIDITSGGMACGPASDTVLFGFDYNTLSKNKNARTIRTVLDVSTNKTYPSMTAAGRNLAQEFGLDPDDRHVWDKIIRIAPFRFIDMDKGKPIVP